MRCPDALPIFLALVISKHLRCVEKVKAKELTIHWMQRKRRTSFDGGYDFMTVHGRCPVDTDFQLLVSAL